MGHGDRNIQEQNNTVTPTSETTRRKIDPDAPISAQTDTKTAEAKQRRFKRRVITIAVIIIIILLLLRFCGPSSGLYASCQGANNEANVNSIATDRNLQVLDPNGDIEEKTEDIIEKMRKMMDESNVPVNINAVPYAEKQGEPLNWLIENPSGSNKNLLIEAYLLNEDGSLGEKIYETKGLLPPSSHVSCKDKNTGETLSGYDYLDKDLKPGTYKAAVLFKGYTIGDDPKYVGTAQAFVDIKIGK